MNITGSPFFSIITASLNAAKTLEATLESVKKQAFKSLEHIVIDGKSTDQSVSILSRYQEKYNLSWISEPDSGIADALNKGLRMTKGRYILVLQADDKFLDSSILETVFHRLKNQKLDIYSFPVILDHPVKGKVLRSPIRLCWWNHFKFILPHQGTFVGRRVIETIGGFRENLSIAMDYDFFYRALANRFSVKFERTPVALMGGDGIGTRPEFLLKRLEEEQLVQTTNETNALWRLAQVAFRSLYLPYKTRHITKWKQHH
jgi:glycosyltransferase involved in cell wall biosynthesis